MAFQTRGRRGVYSGHAGFLERNPSDGKDRPGCRSCGHVVPACLESDGEMVGLLRCAIGDAEAGAWNQPDTFRREISVGRPAAAGTPGTSTPEPGSGAGNGDQPISPARALDYPGACKPWVRGFKVERTAQP